MWISKETCVTGVNPEDVLSKKLELVKDTFGTANSGTARADLGADSLMLKSFMPWHQTFTPSYWYLPTSQPSHTISCHSFYSPYILVILSLKMGLLKILCIQSMIWTFLLKFGCFFLYSGSSHIKIP